MNSFFLFISPFFFPEPISTGKYNSTLVHGLIDSGAVSVEVLCSHPVYPAWKPEVSRAEMPGAVIHRGGAWLRYPSPTFLRRLILELWFFFYVSIFLVRKPHRFEKVVVVFPPSLFMLAVTFLLPIGVPVVGIVHDLQGVYASRSGSIFGRILHGAIAWVERRAFSACRHIVFLSNTMRQTAVSAYGLSMDETSVHYPFVSIRPRRENTCNLDGIFSDGLFSLVYSGALGEKQAPEKLLALMLAVLDERPGWCAKVFSQGPVIQRLRLEYQHPRLKFYPLVAEENVPELLARSSIQIVPQDSGTSDGSLPSKLPNIIYAGARLLCITDPGSELADIVSHYPLGEVATCWDHAECLKAIDRLASRQTTSKMQLDSLLSQFTLAGLVEHIQGVK